MEKGRGVRGEVTEGERGVAQGLWEGNRNRQGNGQHEGHLGVFNFFFFLQKCSFIMESKHLFFFWTKYSSIQA